MSSNVIRKRNADPSMNRLYRKGEIPPELEGRGMCWLHYRNHITGKEDWVFSPFKGNFEYKDYIICKYCGKEVLLESVKAHKNRCPVCKRWNK